MSMEAQKAAAGVGAIVPTRAPRSMRAERFTEFWYYFSVNKGAVLGLAVFALIVAAAIFAPLIAPHAPTDQDRSALLVPPFWQAGGSFLFPLGTDAVGRDVFSRLLYGARYSLFVGVFVVAVSVSTGILFGLLAGYLRGVVDTVIMRVMDIILAVPSLLLALAFVAILEPQLIRLAQLGPSTLGWIIGTLSPGLLSAMISIAVTYQPHFVRLTRASVIAEKQRDYVMAARVVGAGPLRLMWKTILPNCLGPLIVQATLSFSSAILDTAALGFLGMGAKPPTPEWGTMLAEAREFVLRAWWVVTFPGLAILVTVLAVNLIGDGLRDALDPKLKRS